MVLVEGKMTCTRCGRDQQVTNRWMPCVAVFEQIVRETLGDPEGFVCADCHLRASQDETIRRQLEEREKQVRAAREAAAIPARWLDLSWGDLEEDPPRAQAIRAAAKWSRGETQKPGLFLHGPVGRGKSMIAGIAAVARLAHSRVRWMNVARLLQDLQSGYGSPEHDRAVRVLSSMRRGAYVFDDLDKIRPTERSVQPLYLAVNELIELGRPLLITSNKDPEGIAADFGPRFGEAIASRLIEHCNVYPVGGRDRRVNP